MSDDVKKMFWTGVAIVVVILFAASVVTPTKTQIRALETKIQGIDYTSQ